MTYRVNYGNGQVSHTMSKKECFAHIASQELYRGYMLVEFQDPDTSEWFSCGGVT